MNTASNSTSSSTSLMAALLANMPVSEPKFGSLIAGTIVGFDKHGAWVSYGGKTDAHCPSAEFGSEAPKLDDRVNVCVISGRNDNDECDEPWVEDAIVKVSIRLAATRVKLEEARDAGRVVEVRVGNIVRKGGGIKGVSVFFDGLRGFIPYSLLGRRNAVESLKGQTLTVKVDKLSREDSNIVFNHRQVEGERRQADQARIDDCIAGLKPGDVVTAVVKNIGKKEDHEFGAFVSFMDGVSGLIHRSEIPGVGRGPVSAVLTVGKEVQATVLAVKEKDGKREVSLSLNKKHEQARFVRSVARDQVFEGVVRSSVDYGLFVEIDQASGFCGLLHVSKLRGHAGIAVGDKLTVKVEKFDTTKLTVGLMLA